MLKEEMELIHLLLGVIPNLNAANSLWTRTWDSQCCFSEVTSGLEIELLGCSQLSQGTEQHSLLKVLACMLLQL